MTLESARTDPVDQRCKPKKTHSWPWKIANLAIRARWRCGGKLKGLPSYLRHFNGTDFVSLLASRTGQSGGLARPKLTKLLGSSRESASAATPLRRDSLDVGLLAIKRPVRRTGPAEAHGVAGKQPGVRLRGFAAAAGQPSSL